VAEEVGVHQLVLLQQQGQNILHNKLILKNQENILLIIPVALVQHQVVAEVQAVQVRAEVQAVQVRAEVQADQVVVLQEHQIIFNQ